MTILLQIYRATLIGKTLSDVTPIAENGLTAVEGLAVDWIGENLYWIEGTLDQIEVSRLDGSYRRTLVSGGIESPRALAVDSREAVLFWTDWERGAPRIESCDMSGNQASRRVVYASGDASNSWPNGLSLDLDARRVYWIDARTDSVHTAFYDGSDARVVLKGGKYVSHPFAITVFESHVYWTDWRTTSVVRAGKFNGSALHVEDKILGQAFDVKVVHGSRQPRSASDDPKMRCRLDNGGCSHLCLLSNSTGHVCACPHMMRLADDSSTCIDNEVVLLVSRQNEISGVGVDQSDEHIIPPIPLPTRAAEDGVKLDFDADSKTVFWLNVGRGFQEIKRSALDGSDVKTVLDRALVDCQAFAVDWASKTIYFSSRFEEEESKSPEKSASSSIYVSNYEGEFISSVVHKNPGLIGGLVVVPTLGMMYWNDDDGRVKETLYMSRMDGSDVHQIKFFFRDGPKSSRSLISSLTYVSHKLYWVNQRESDIFSWDFTTSSMTQLNRRLPPGAGQLAGLAVHNGRIFVGLNYNDANWHSILRDDHVFRNGSKSVLALRVYDADLQRGSNGCTANKCEHLCLPKSDTQTVCACAMGSRLFNRTSCVSSPLNALIHTSPRGLSGRSIFPERSETLLAPLSDVGRPISVASLPSESLLFWIDGTRGCVYRASREGSARKVVVSHLQSPARMAVDWVAKNLYWTDNMLDVIEMADIEGRHRYVVISGNMDRPHAIALDSAAGLLFWTDIGQMPKLERSGLDGSDRNVLVAKNIKSPSGLTTDPSSRSVFWCDSDLSLVESVNYDGLGRRVVLREGNALLERPQSVVYFQNYVYWLDALYQQGSISRVKV